MFGEHELQRGGDAMVIEWIKVVVDLLKIALTISGMLQDLFQRRAARREKTTTAPRQAPRRRSRKPSIRCGD